MGRFRLGTASVKKLATCHPLLQDVIEEAILRTPMDFAVLEGWRGKEAQNAAFSAKPQRSTTPWPKSKHNHMEGGKPCSLAVDVAPYYATLPHFRWEHDKEFRWLAGFIMGIGARITEPKGYRLRWLGDSDDDGVHTNQKGLIDLPHLELVQLL